MRAIKIWLAVLFGFMTFIWIEGSIKEKHIVRDQDEWWAELKNFVHGARASAFSVPKE